MDKIFLSHSSKDKQYIRPIFEYVGGDRCMFDEMTFETGMQTMKEIFASAQPAEGTEWLGFNRLFESNLRKTSK